MVDSRRRELSDLDINTIRQLYSAHKVEWTSHVSKRLLQRGISSSEVEASINTGAIIENYPDDYPYPSCLLMGKSKENRVLHIVCAINNDTLWIITAYEPNMIEWEADFKTRKEQSQ